MVLGILLRLYAVNLRRPTADLLWVRGRMVRGMAVRLISWVILTSAKRQAEGIITTILSSHSLSIISEIRGR